MVVGQDSCAVEIYPDNLNVAKRLTIRLNELYAGAGQPHELRGAYQDARALIQQCRWINPNVLASVQMIPDEDELLIKVKLRRGERSLSVYFSDEIHIRRENGFGKPGFLWEDYTAPLGDQAQITLSLDWLKGDVS
jgi:hypothetical protein